MVPAAVKLLTVRSVGAAAMLLSVLRGRPAGAAPVARAPRIVRTSARAALFEENRGQSDPEVAFLSRGRSDVSFLLPGEIALALPGASSSSRDAVRILFRGANPDAEIAGRDALPGRSNHFLGRDPARWRTGVPQFAGVTYRGLYLGYGP